MTLERLKQLRAMVYADYECLSEFGDDVQYEKDLLELIDAEIERNKSGKWISVKERMPQTDTCVLVTDGTNITVAYWFHANNKIYWNAESCDSFYNAIYWMPLPEAPKEVK